MRTVLKDYWWRSGGAAEPMQLVSNPVIQGVAREESILYVTDGQWKDNPNAIAYQWKRDGVNISGATKGSYTLVAADVGTEVTCEVTMQNTYLGYSNSVEVSAGTIVQSYAEDILDLSPIALWRLNETSGTTADNAEGTAARDATLSANLLLDTCFFKDGSYAIKSPTSTTNFNINVYSSSLNTAFNKNTGALSFWIRPDTVDKWSSTGFGANPYVFQFEIDSSNRFRMITLNNGSWRIGRRSGGTNKDVDVDMSSNPTGWQHFLMTWDTVADELKVYLNGVQQGSTLTGLSSIAGALASTKCCLLAGDTSNTGPLQGWRMANFAIFDFVPTEGQRTTLSTAPQGKWWKPITTTFDIESIFPDVTQGASVNSFLYDVDNDGELELVGEIGSRPHYAAIKSDGTIVWETEVSETQYTASRTPQIRNGVMYFGHQQESIRAIRLSDGVVLWTNNTAGGFDMMTCSSEGLVVVRDVNMNVLNYSTGVSIGGNFPVTLGFQASNTQTLSAGDIDADGRDEFMVSEKPSGNGRMACYDHDGTLLWSRNDDQSHIDRFEVADIGGTTYVICVIDTINSTSGSSEGKELVLLDVTDGSVVDTYVGSSNGVAYCTTKKLGNGIEIVYSVEGSHELGALDENLEEVFTPVTSFAQGGSLCGAMRAMGTWVIMTNGDAETDPDQFFIDENGNLLRFFTDDAGMDWTNVIDAKGGFNVRVEQGKQVGNHRDFFYILARRQRGGTAVTDLNYFWNRFELADIP